MLRVNALVADMWRARVFVTLKPIVNDPQGLSIRGGLQQLGYESVESVRAGKLIEIRLAADDRLAAERQVDEMGRPLVAEPGVEEFRFTLARFGSLAARPVAHRNPLALFAV